MVEKNGGRAKNRYRKVMIFFFLLIICFGFFHFCTGIIRSERINRQSIEPFSQPSIIREQIIDLYGGIQQLIGKRQIENFTIVRNNYFGLVAPKTEIARQRMEIKIAEIETIWNYLRSENIQFLYIKPPLPIANNDDLPYGVKDYSKINASSLHTYLSDIQTIDLAKHTKLSKESVFYRTDHHWSGDASFEAYLILSEWMVRNNVINSGYSRDEFEKHTIEGFLGSYGVKVGKYYNGLDSYVFYQPVFPTMLEFNMCDINGKVLETHCGEWYDALMDNRILTDSNYKNKYNAALWGNSGINQIINKNRENGKLLLISHSYGRPLAQYLSLNFHEVRQIDPQEGRFNGDYISYIRDFKPDFVVFLCEFEGELIGEYMTISQ